VVVVVVGLCLLSGRVISFGISGRIEVDSGVIAFGISGRIKVDSGVIVVVGISRQIRQIRQRIGIDIDFI